MLGPVAGLKNKMESESVAALLCMALGTGAGPMDWTGARSDRRRVPTLARRTARPHVVQSCNLPTRARPRQKLPSTFQRNFDLAPAVCGQSHKDPPSSQFPRLHFTGAASG